MDDRTRLSRSIYLSVAGFLAFQTLLFFGFHRAYRFSGGYFRLSLFKIGRAHVLNPVTEYEIVCRLMLEKKKRRQKTKRQPKRKRTKKRRREKRRERGEEEKV